MLWLFNILVSVVMHRWFGTASYFWKFDPFCFTWASLHEILWVFRWLSLTFIHLALCNVTSLVFKFSLWFSSIMACDIKGIKRHWMVSSMALSTSILSFYQAFWTSVGGFNDLGCIVVALLLTFLVILTCSFGIHFVIHLNMLSTLARIINHRQIMWIRNQQPSLNLIDATLANGYILSIDI